MDLSDAQKFLGGTIRHELRDHAFGDAEVFWTKDDKEVAGGYFGGGNASVWIRDKELDQTMQEPAMHFDGEAARELRKCGTVGHIERNDETGPDEYQEGTTMPGLTKEGVFKELTGKDWVE